MDGYVLRSVARNLRDINILRKKCRLAKTNIFSLQHKVCKIFILTSSV